METVDIPISEILPQQPPFRFVDALVRYGGDVVETEFTPGEGGVFVREGRLQSAGLLEHMAQSCAARVGYIARYILHIPVKIGYIGSFKGLRIHRLPRTGERIRTTVTHREEIFGICLSDVVVRSGGEILAEASLKTVTGKKEITK